MRKFTPKGSKTAPTKKATAAPRTGGRTGPDAPTRTKPSPSGATPRTGARPGPRAGAEGSGRAKSAPSTTTPRRAGAGAGPEAGTGSRAGSGAVSRYRSGGTATARPRTGAAPESRGPARRPAAPKALAPRPATPRPAAPPRSKGAGQDRLQKILAAAGVASRRACEAVILEGRVQVNGRTITELGTLADPRRDVITVDLQPIEREAPIYILMNKPKGYVTTVRDDQGRPTVMALLKGVPGRLYPVGRLDFNSEGLLLMTNDGALAQVLMGPEHEIPKVYLVKVHRTPRPELVKELQEGFLLSGRRLKPCHIEIAEKGDNPWLKVTLTEGKNQQIRRMFAAVGHPVSKLRRVQFGPLADPLLKPGAWRYLSPQEIAAIKSL